MGKGRRRGVSCLLSVEEMRLCLRRKMRLGRLVWLLMGGSWILRLVREMRARRSLLVEEKWSVLTLEGIVC